MPPEDVVFHRFYMNKTGPIRAKAKKKASVLDEDTGELLADDVSDGSDDDMQDLGEGPTDDGDYDYEDLDSDAFEEDQDLLRDDSDVDLGSISDDSASEDVVMENDSDDDVAFLESAGDSDGNFSDEAIDVSNSDHGSNAERKRKRKHGAKSGASPFASLEDYEHLLDRDSDKPASKRKQKVGGEKKPKLRSHKKRSKTSG